MDSHGGILEREENSRVKEIRPDPPDTAPLQSESEMLLECDSVLKLPVFIRV